MTVLRFRENGALDWRETLAGFQANLADARNKAALRQRWNDLQVPPAALRSADARKWKQRRGYELEQLILLLAHLEGLDPMPSYRGTGEQIDGFFKVDSRSFLMEAKWHEKQATASDVFAFQGKLRGKLTGTLGLFISVAGFSDDAEKAIVFGKEIDVLLADQSDIDLALAPERTLHEMVGVKVREAARLGVVNYKYQRWLDQRDPLRP